MRRSWTEAREKAKGSYDRRVDWRVDWRVLEDSHGRFADDATTLRSRLVRRRVRKGPSSTPRSRESIRIEFLQRRPLPSASTFLWTG
jgi:hypothetical protein